MAAHCGLSQITDTLMLFSPCGEALGSCAVCTAPKPIPSLCPSPATRPGRKSSAGCSVASGAAPCSLCPAPETLQNSALLLLPVSRGGLGCLWCVSLSSVPAKLQSCVKSHLREHLLATSGTSHLPRAKILWLFPFERSGRELWGLGMKLGWLLQIYFGV